MRWMDDLLRRDPQLAKAVEERLEEMRREAEAFEVANEASTPERDRGKEHE